MQPTTTQGQSFPASALAHLLGFDLIESRFRHLMRVAVSVREGTISSSAPLKHLRSGARKNAAHAAFREVGRVIRTVQLQRYLSDAPLRRTGPASHRPRPSRMTTAS